MILLVIAGQFLAQRTVAVAGAAVKIPPRKVIKFRPSVELD